jgi:hypothetical protein
MTIILEQQYDQPYHMFYVISDTLNMISLPFSGGVSSLQNSFVWQIGREKYVWFFDFGEGCTKPEWEESPVELENLW